MKDGYRIKNIAVVAHVDHGKTTLVDGLLQQSGVFSKHSEIQERVMDSGELERERGITIKAKNCSFSWQGCKVNLLDTPGHADFGGEVERGLMMVDGVLLLVDASEGCLPQTRFVLSKALERKIKVGVVINKIDRPDERIEEVKSEIEDLFLELATTLDVADFDLDIPFIYASAKNGWATNDYKEPQDNMHVILDFIASDYFPEPQVTKEGALKLLVTNLSYSSYLGALAIGRIEQGKLKKNNSYNILTADNSKKFKLTSISVYDKLDTTEIEEAQAGEIVIISGIEGAKIGDTISDLDCPKPLARIEIEPSTVGIFVSVNTSPLNGKEGNYLTSRKLEEFLIDSCRHNISLRYQATDDPKIFKLMSRGELQLAIVFEELRRQGYEFMLSRPEVLFSTDGSQNKTEPYEKLVMDIPVNSIGAITEKLSARKGTLESMNPITDERTRVEFVIPSRGVIGYRSKFLTDTRGEGIMSSEYLGYRPYAGDTLARQNGAIIADRPGNVTTYALFHLLPLGEQFVIPGVQCYEGMIIGQHTRKNDTNVNPTKEKHLTSMRASGKETALVLTTVTPLTLESALDWIGDDEWVEATPSNIRICKKTLNKSQRSVIR